MYSFSETTICIYITTQPARVLFTNHTKTTIIKAASHLSPFLKLVQTHHWSLELVNIRAKQKRLNQLSVNQPRVPVYWESTRSQVPLNRMLTDSSWRWICCFVALLDSVLVKPAETLSEVPAQRDREDVDEAEQSKGVEQHHCVFQER